MTTSAESIGGSQQQTTDRSKLAFLAGFSERYFLQLFNLKNDDQKPIENMVRNTSGSEHQTRDRKANV